VLFAFDLHSNYDICYAKIIPSFCRSILYRRYHCWSVYSIGLCTVDKGARATCSRTSGKRESGCRAMSGATRVAVIVVSFNTRDLLRACLQSIDKSAQLAGKDQIQVEAIVVDGKSHDGSAKMVTAEFPHVRLLALDENVGFTAGNNLGLKVLGFDIESAAQLPADTGLNLSSERPDFVLLLNPDAELIDDALIRMTKFLSTKTIAGGCGAQLHYADGSFQHGAFRLPSLAQVLLDFFPLEGVRGAHRLHSSRWNGRYSASLWQGEQPFEVDFVLGAAMMVRGSLVDQIGGLDEEFFMYCEEMDWCVRLAQAGHPVYAVPTARVLHHAGKSSSQIRWPMVVQLWRSRTQFYKKHCSLYPIKYHKILRVVMKNSLWRKERQAHTRFERGNITQAELQAELDAYAEIRGFI